MNLSCQVPIKNTVLESADGTIKLVLDKAIITNISISEVAQYAYNKNKVATCFTNRKITLELEVASLDIEEVSAAPAGDGPARRRPEEKAAGYFSEEYQEPDFSLENDFDYSLPYDFNIEDIYF